MNKKDVYIAQKLKEDKNISFQAEEIFKKFKGGIELENNKNEKKVIKINIKQFMAIAASLVIVLFLGTNIYAHSKGLPNIFTVITNLFNTNQEKYNESEQEINKTVESNGVKLTLKTAAMDENVLILKYIAEGEQLRDSIVTFEDITELVKQEETLKDDMKKGNSGDKTVTDVMVIKNNINRALKKLDYNGNSTELLSKIRVAYQSLISFNNGTEGVTLEIAQEQLNAARALYETNINQKDVIVSNDTMQNIKITALEQTVSKKDGKFEIYVVYAVDTISDLANEFKLNINATQVGTIEGSWNYETVLNKSQLNTRVETIDFYNQLKSIETIDVIIKKLSISDFSSVLMIQTDFGDYEYENGSDNNIFPFVYIITDEQGNVVGNGNNVKILQEKYNVMPTKYTDRLILKNVNKDTDILYVKLYSNNDNKLLDTITLDIDVARNKKNIELTEDYVSSTIKDCNIYFKYPSDWKVIDIPNDNSYFSIESSSDVDGNKAQILINRIDNPDKKSLQELTSENCNLESLQEGTIMIDGIEGYYKEFPTSKETAFENKIYSIVLCKDDVYYGILYSGVETQYIRHFEEFQRILETISINSLKLVPKEVLYIQCIVMNILKFQQLI